MRLVRGISKLGQVEIINQPTIENLNIEIQEIKRRLNENQVTNK